MSSTVFGSSESDADLQRPAELIGVTPSWCRSEAWQAALPTLTGSMLYAIGQNQKLIPSQMNWPNPERDIG